MSTGMEQGRVNESCDDDNIEYFEIYQLIDEEDGSVLDEYPPPKAAGGEMLQPGDHVYMWCTLYQHHGIVLDTTKYWQQKVSSGSPPCILLAEFTNVALAEEMNSKGNDGESSGSFTLASTASRATTIGTMGGFRILREPNPSEKWHKVKYRANPLESLTWRPGTCSAATPDDVSSVLQRVQFLRECSANILPDYHLLACNCETVAVWCVTGKWETLQGDRALFMSQLAAGAGVAALTGGLGMAAVAASGLTACHSRHIGNQCKETADALDKEFAWYSLGKTPEFDFDPCT